LYHIFIFKFDDAKVLIVAIIAKFLGYSAQKCDEWRTISILLTQERNNNPILFRTFAAVKVTDEI